ncbi:sulfite exporter TauE/SafE family protein [Pantoea sp.]|uniref:sulfite exporter TauE/SafE family protein n=1 Tax=Pantoea sp. TaxID=69393 RepID=UPI0028B00FC6|nr:sulfite exporter TauE/SafE family protein [Pantoea sp.]
MNDILTLILVGFATGITTILFGFGGGFVVVPFVYQRLSHQPALAGYAMHIAVATSTAVMVFNAGWASWQNWRVGKLHTQVVFPLLWFIAAGAFGGAWLAGILTDNEVRLLFILYLLATLADCLLRKGFMQPPAYKPLSAITLSAGGIVIGFIAALLGVGGSVMTVPLLRRHGYAMENCVSAANPLSLPVALCGAGMYSLGGPALIPQGDYLGFINLKILLLLTVAGFCGMLFSHKYIPRVPDVWHARIYLLLLFLVLTGILI